MPAFAVFCEPGAYYATLAHEMTHYADLRIMPHGGRKGLSRKDWYLTKSA